MPPTYRSSVVVEAEVSLGAEVRFGVLGVLAVLTMKFLHKTLVTSLREPALLVQQGQDTHGLQGGKKSTVYEGPWAARKELTSLIANWVIRLLSTYWAY